MVIVSSANPSMQLIQATAPDDWVRLNWVDALPAIQGDLVVLCEENTFPKLPRGAVAIVLDSVRYPEGFLWNLPNIVVTLDAPARGATFMWTPIRAELFHPKPWSERAGVICPVRLKNYPMRQKAVSKLEKIGVKIIERDDEKRSYQDYVNDLCSARAVVNFCQDRKTGKTQVKGRVFEALTAGALLLEQWNEHTGSVLPPASFVGWRDLDELEKLCEAIVKAEALSYYSFGLAEQFSARRFWAVIEKLAA